MYFLKKYLQKSASIQRRTSLSKLGVIPFIYSFASSRYTCECMAGYDGDGYSQCSLKPDAYASYVAPQFVRITPESSLDHGWRVYEILLYSDEKCAGLFNRPRGSEAGRQPNFGGLVLGCIDADFCK